MDQSSMIRKNLEESVELKNNLLQDDSIIKLVEEIAETLVHCLKQDGKVLFCGNGGSAADAQHLAAEFSGRYYYDRPPLFAEALHVNTSYLTAVANDYSYNDIYSRLVEAKGRQGDVLIGMSTSGNSGNVVEAMKKGKEMGMITVGMMGQKKGGMNQYCDLALHIPSTNTPRIQECHMLLGHAICEWVECKLFPK